MSVQREPLIFAIQGDELSYHAKAVTEFIDKPVGFATMDTFGGVVRTTRNETNLGAIAICTVAGTVDASAKEIVCQRPSALPSVVGRQDIEVQLGLIGSCEQTIDELSERGREAKCLAQMAAMLQCEPFFEENLPLLKRGRGNKSKGLYRGESIKAVREALSKKSPDWLAIGPSFAAEALDGHMVGPDQINPLGSVTSFYVLQQETDPKVLPEHPDKTEPRAVISLAHPEGVGEFAKCMEMAVRMGIKISRFIPFDIGDFTKHNKDVRRGGGIFEIAHTRTSGIVAEFSARIAGLEDNDGFGGPFNVRNLGGFMWYPEADIDPLSLIPDENEAPTPYPTVNIDRFKHDLSLDKAKLIRALQVANRSEAKAIAKLVEEMSTIVSDTTAAPQDSSSPEQ